MSHRATQVRLIVVFSILTILVAPPPGYPDTSCIPAPEGMVGWWAADGSARDLSGRGRDGQLVGGAAFLPGHTETAFALGGNGAYVSLPPLGLTSGTVEFWINPAQVVGDGGLRLFSQTTSQYWTGASGATALGLSAEAGSVWVWSSPSWVRLAGQGAVSANAWAHLAFVYSAWSVTLYLNGVQQGSATTRFDFSDAPMGIGAPYLLNYGISFPGLIDEFTVYDRALSADQIQAIAETGAAGKCKALRAYVTSENSDNVSVVDLAANSIVATVPIGEPTHGVTTEPGGTRVYVTSAGGLSVIDTRSNSVVGNVPMPGTGPWGLAVTPSGDRVYVANNQANVVSVVDPDTATVVDTVPVGTGPQGVTINPPGTRVYVGNTASNTISVIDTATDTVLATIPSVGGSPNGIAINGTSTRLYVANTGYDTLTVIDATTNTILATVPVGAFPRGVAVTPDGAHVYVANQNGSSVSVVRTLDNSVSTIPISTSSGYGPVGLAVAPDGSKVYVAHLDDNRLYTLSTASNTVIDQVELGCCVHPIAFGQFVTRYNPLHHHQTITFTGLANRTYGDPPFAVNATASSGLPVTFEAVGNCSASGSTITFTGAGSCAVTASQAGDANYEPAIPVSQSFVISKAAQTTSFAALPSRTYGDPPFGVTAAASSGLGVTFSGAGQCAVNGAATVILTGAGGCAITASQAGDSNYLPAQDVTQNFPIAPAPTSTIVSTDPNPSNAGQMVTLTATVNSAAAPSTGSVTFLDGGIVLGIQPLSGGQTSLSTGSLSVGMHVITAQYSGDADRLGSTSAPLTHTVLTTSADLVTISVSNPPETANLGGTFAVTDTVLNQGQQAVGSTTTRYYLSLDIVKSGNDRQVGGTRGVPPLDPARTSTGGTTVQVPLNVPLGAYFLLACADDPGVVSEADEGNNCAASSAKVQLVDPGPPDLAVTYLTNPPATIARRATFLVDDTVLNQGTGVAGNSVNRYYLSADGVAPTRLLSGSRSVGPLGPSQTSAGVGTSVQVANGTALGTYYLLVCADDKQQVAESTETNNCRASTSRAQVTP